MLIFSAFVVITRPLGVQCALLIICIAKSNSIALCMPNLYLYPCGVYIISCYNLCSDLLDSLGTEESVPISGVNWDIKICPVY